MLCLSCSTQDPWLQCVGSSSLTRDWTQGPCIARQILNHWITRQVASLVSFSWKYSPSSPIYTMLYLYLSYDSQLFLPHIFVNMYDHVLYPFWSVSSQTEEFCLICYSTLPIEKCLALMCWFYSWCYLLYGILYIHKDYVYKYHTYIQYPYLYLCSRINVYIKPVWWPL